MRRRMNKSKIARRMLAIVAAVVLTMSMVAPVGAYRYMTGTTQKSSWSDTTVTYCAQNAPSTTHYNTAMAAIERWDPYLDRIALNPTDGSWGCQITLTFGRQVEGVAGYTGISLSNGVISDADIFINTGWVTMWQYGAEQNCYVGVGNGCLPNMWTIVMHEAGHALGLAHNTTVDSGRCSTGFYSTGSLSACDFYGEAIMHWNAGIEFMNDDIGHGYIHQGYKHAWPAADDIAGMEALYGL